MAQAQETQWERLRAQEKQGAAARGAEPAQSLPCARRAAALAVAHRSACDTRLREARGQRLLLTGISFPYGAQKQIFLNWVFLI